MSDPDDIDPDAIAEIRAVGGDSLLIELIEIFESSAPPQLETLRTAVRAGDTTAAARAAHALRSAAGNFGARALIDEASALEAAARRGDAAILEWRLRSIEERFTRVRDGLRGVARSLDSDGAGDG